MAMRFQSTYLLSMHIRQRNRFLQSSTIQALNFFILRASKNQIILPLNNTDPKTMLPQRITTLLFEVIIENKRSLVITQSYFSMGRAKMDRVDFLVAISDCILAIEGIFKLIIHRHVVEVKMLVVCSADEVVIGPVQQIRVVVINPTRYLESTYRNTRPHYFANNHLFLLLLLSLLDCVLSDSFAFE